MIKNAYIIFVFSNDAAQGAILRFDNNGMHNDQSNVMDWNFPTSIKNP